jgi:hypothetical protein
MIQKFELTLLARKVFADPEAFARRLFVELKGCTVLDATSAGEERTLVVTMQANHVDEEYTTEELKETASPIRIVCDRAGVIIKDVRRIKTNGLFDEVQFIFVGRP